MKATYKRTAPYRDDEMNLPVKSVADALPFYQTVMGFTIESQSDTPQKSAILSRDNVKIGLSENGGDPTQDGSFFEVDNVETAYAELHANGLTQDEPAYRIDTHGDKSYKVFFVVAPDGLCYCLGEHVSNTEAA